jgi:hypothetical protein
MTVSSLRSGCLSLASVKQAKEKDNFLVVASVVDSSVEDEVVSILCDSNCMCFIAPLYVFRSCGVYTAAKLLPPFYTKSSYYWGF